MATRTFKQGTEYINFLKSGGVPSAGDRVESENGSNYYLIEDVKTTPEGVSFITAGPAIITSTGERQGQSQTYATYKGKFPGRGSYSPGPISGVSEQDVLSFLKHNEPTFQEYITPPPQTGVPVITGPHPEVPAPQQPQAQAMDNTPVIDPRFGTQPIPGAEYAQRYATLTQPKPQVLGVQAGAKAPERNPGESIEDFTRRIDVESKLPGIAQQVQNLIGRVQTEGVTGPGGQVIIPPGVQQQAPRGVFTGGQVGGIQPPVQPQPSPQGQPGVPQGLPGIQPQPTPTPISIPTPTPTPTQTPSPTPTPPPPQTPTLKPTPPPVVGTSESERAKARAEALAKTKAELETGLTKPAPFTSVQEFQRLRQEQGVVQDEGELSAIRNEALAGKQELRQFIPGQTGLPEAGRLGAISEAERNLNFRLEGLAIRERAVLDRLNTKNSYLNTVLQLGQEDYNRAYTDYTNEFNKNLKSVEFYNDKLDDEQKDALTAFTTIANLFKDKQITKLDSAISTQMDVLALKIGLPAGVFQTALASMQDEKILTPIQVDTATGKDVYFFTQSSDGTPNLRKVESLPGALTGDIKRGDDYSKAEQFIADNPNASREEIENEILKNTSLNATEVDRLLESKGIIKETSLTDDQLREKAEQIYQATGSGLFGLFGKDKEKAKELARVGIVEVDSKDIKLSARQIQKIIDFLDEKY